MRGLAVIVVNYRTPDLAIRCVDALAPARASFPDLRVVVVDGGSADGSAERLAAALGERDWVTLLPLEVNGGFAFANLVDFDSEHGHRRDVAGYAACLERFDRRLPELLAVLRDGDLLVITADHGNDPTFRGTDHTRECVPLLAFRPGAGCGPLGRRGFDDVGATIARHLGLAPTASGRAWP